MAEVATSKMRTDWGNLLSSPARELALKRHWGVAKRRRKETWGGGENQGKKGDVICERPITKINFLKGKYIFVKKKKFQKRQNFLGSLRSPKLGLKLT